MSVRSGIKAFLTHLHRVAFDSSSRKNVTIDKMSIEFLVHSMFTYLHGIDSTHFAKLHQLCADLSTIALAVDSYQPNLKYSTCAMESSEWTGTRPSLRVTITNYDATC